MSIYKEPGSIAQDNHPNDLPKPQPVPQSSERLLGIDVSHYEPRLDWMKARLSGVRYMYTKCTEGTSHVDALAKDHIADAKAAGVPTGLYHFFHASQSPEVQARNFLDHYDRSCELPPCLDWEGSSGDGLSPSSQRAVAKVWLEIVQRELKRIPLIYGGESHLREMNLDQSFLKYPLWLAHYKTTEARLQIPKPWATFTIWQYDDAGKVDGLGAGHTVDVSVLNGGKEALDRLMAL